jgi:hypothetical protein
MGGDALYCLVNQDRLNKVGRIEDKDNTMKEFTQAEYERLWNRAEMLEKELHYAREQKELAQRDALMLQGKVRVLMDTIVEIVVALRANGIRPPMQREMYPGGMAHEVPYTGVMGASDPGHNPKAAAPAMRQEASEQQPDSPVVPHDDQL